MAATYEEVDLLDMELDQEQEVFRYPCPCGDKFFITIEELFENEDKATCPSCSLILKVEYDAEKLERRIEFLQPNEEDQAQQEETESNNKEKTES